MFPRTHQRKLENVQERRGVYQKKLHRVLLVLVAGLLLLSAVVGDVSCLSTGW